MYGLVVEPGSLGEGGVTSLFIFFNLFIYLLIFSKHFILVSVTVDSEPILGTLNLRQECIASTLQGTIYKQRDNLVCTNHLHVF